MLKRFGVVPAVPAGKEFFLDGLASRVHRKRDSIFMIPRRKRG